VTVYIKGIGHKAMSGKKMCWKSKKDKITQ